MNLNRLFTSPQFITKIFLYLAVIIVVMAGIGIITYQVMDIINLQESIGEFEQKLQSSVQSAAGLAEVKEKTGVSGQQGANQKLSQLLKTRFQIKQLSAGTPFQPPLDRESKPDKGRSKMKVGPQQPVKREANKDKSLNKELQSVKLKVVGILSNPEEKIAIIKLKQGTNKSVTEGGVVKDWQVKKIAAGKVVLVPVVKKISGKKSKLNKRFVLTLGGD